MCVVVEFLVDANQFEKARGDASRKLMGAFIARCVCVCVRKPNNNKAFIDVIAFICYSSLENLSLLS